MIAVNRISYILCQYDDVVGGKFIVNVHYLEPECRVMKSDLEAIQFEETKECVKGSAQFRMGLTKV